jgi:K+-sensing histidine kinase KdpD
MARSHAASSLCMLRQPRQISSTAVKHDGENAILEVENNGVASLKKLSPTFSSAFTAPTRHVPVWPAGPGLGLSIVKAICTAHGALVKVFSAEGEGSTFRVKRPIATTATSPAPKAAVPEQVERV